MRPLDEAEQVAPTRLHRLDLLADADGGRGGRVEAEGVHRERRRGALHPRLGVGVRALAVRLRVALGVHALLLPDGVQPRDGLVADVPEVILQAPRLSVRHVSPRGPVEYVSLHVKLLDILHVVPV